MMTEEEWKIKDKDELKSLLAELKEEHCESWTRIKDEVLGMTENVRKKLLSQTHISKEELPSINSIITNINEILGKKILWVWGQAQAQGKTKNVVKFINREDFRDILKKASEIASDEEIRSIEKELREIINKPQTKLATMSSWLSLINPRMFIPVNEEVLPKYLRNKLHLKVFWGRNTDIQLYFDFLETLHSIRRELGIESMMEVAYYLTKAPPEISSDHKRLREHFALRGYHYPPHLVAQFYTALKTKGFVILSGLTGTGKTKIAQELAELLDPSKENFLFLSVRPDWRDSKPLLGYYNPLTKQYQKTPLLELIMRATRDYQENEENAMPYFVLLDEMNLAHVEYYFADFLSVLESGRDENGFTRESIKLHDVEKVEEEQGIPKEIKLPPNLYIIGTVNMDETTYSFSPKVLDRAFTVEFHDVELEGYPPETVEQESSETPETLRREILNDLRGKNGKFLARPKDGKFLARPKEEINEAVEELKGTDYWNALENLNQALEPYDLHFGYRVVDEIALFFKKARESQERGIVEFKDEDEIFDLALLMKVLPKFHGNRRKLEKPLLVVLKMAKEGGLKGGEAEKGTDELWNDILGEDALNKRVERIIEELGKTGDYKYRHTARKVLRMLRQLYEIGFASFS